MTYRLDDRTNPAKNTGYLSLLLDGKRVCDFFPYAAETDPGFIRKQAALIRDTMNSFASPAPQEGSDES